jgi:hypothetical protein
MRALHTPQQETNSAYNPGVTFQGGQFLAQGISQAGDAITEGLQRYAQNKQESAALDMRFEGTAKPLMEKLKLYGQLADENSPAAALLDKSANWHKLGTSQKKVLLADMMLLGDKTEAEQRRKEAEQYKLLEIQDRQAQFDELKRQHRITNDRNWLLDMRDAGQRSFENVRQMGADARAERSTALAEQTHADTLAQRAAAQREKQAVDKDVAGFWNYVAPRVTAPAGMGPTLPLDMAAIEGMSQFPRTRQDPNLDNLVGALGRMQPKPDWSPSVQVVDGVRFGTTSPSSAQVLPGPDAAKPLPPVMKTVKDPRTGVEYRVPMTPADYEADQLANPPAAEIKKRGDRAALETELEQHLAAIAKQDERYGVGNLYSRQNRVVEIKRKLAELGAPAPAAAAPAAAADDKVIVEKDGKAYRLPRGQLEKAQRQGYRLRQ